MRYGRACVVNDIMTNENIIDGPEEVLNIQSERILMLVSARSTYLVLEQA